MARDKAYGPGTLVMRASYEGDLAAGRLGIGGDLWTNEVRMYAQVFRAPEVEACRAPYLTTGLWADVEYTRSDSPHVLTMRVYG